MEMKEKHGTKTAVTNAEMISKPNILGGVEYFRVTRDDYKFRYW